MLHRSVLSGIQVLRVQARRNIGASAVVLQKEATDPIQKLFLDKVREYKSRSKGDKLVDPSPEIEKEYKSEMERVAKTFGGSAGADMSKFPEFKFEEPKIDPISILQSK